MATYTSSGDGYFTDVVTASHTSADTIIIRQGDIVSGNVHIDCYDMYISGNFNTMSGSTSYNLTTADKVQVGIGTAPGSVDGTLHCNESTLSIASGSLTSKGLFLYENATVVGGGGEWFVGNLSADGGNDNALTMTTGACWINGSFNDGICLAMRGNTSFNANGGLIGICGSGTQYYFERNNTSRVFNNFMIDKSVGRGGGGIAVSSAAIASSVFAPYAGYIPEKMTVLRYFHNYGGTFDLLGQSGGYGGGTVTYASDVPANCMDFDVSGAFQQGGGWGSSARYAQYSRGTCKLLCRSANVDLVPTNVWTTATSVPLTSGSDLNGGWTSAVTETGTDGQTDTYLFPYRVTWPYGVAMRGDAYISGGTSILRTGNPHPFIGDGNVAFAYDNFASGNSMYSRVVPPTGNNAAFFDGEASNQWAYQADATVYDLDSDGTVSAWVYINSTHNTDTYAALVSKGCAAGWDTDGWGLSYFANNATYMTIRNGGDTSSATFTNTLFDQWFHLAGTWDGSDVKIYQNGVLKTTTAATHQPAQTTTDVRIAADPNGRALEARIADVRLYSEAKDVTFISGTLYATNSATDLSTDNFGKYAASGTNMVAWWRLNRTVTGTTSLADYSVTDAGNLSVNNGPIRCHSGHWAITSKNANSAGIMSSYQGSYMGGVLGVANYPETAYGAADGYAWALDCASGSLVVFSPVASSGNAKGMSGGLLYQTMPNYGHVTEVALSQNYWWHFWNVTFDSGDYGTTTWKCYSHASNQCFFTRIHGDMVIGDESTGIVTYGLNAGMMGGDEYPPSNKWAYYTTAGPYNDLIIDGALVVGISGGFDYAGTSVGGGAVTDYSTPGWNHGSAYMDAKSNQNYIIPPKITAGGIFCSGGKIKFAKRNPLMCDWSGIAVADWAKNPVTGNLGALDQGCAWTRGRLKDCNLIQAPPFPTGSLWDNEGGSRYGMGRDTIDLPEVEVTQESMSISQRPWYKSYMGNRSVQLQYAGNTDIFLPSATDTTSYETKAAYHGDYGSLLKGGSMQVVLPDGGDLYTVSGVYLQKSTQPILYGDFICTEWQPNGGTHGMDISGNLDIRNGDGYDKNNTCNGATTNIGGNLIIGSGGKLYSSGTTFNINGSAIINADGEVKN